MMKELQYQRRRYQRKKGKLTPQSLGSTVGWNEQMRKEAETKRGSDGYTELIGGRMTTWSRMETPLRNNVCIFVSVLISA